MPCSGQKGPVRISCRSCSLPDCRPLGVSSQGVEYLRCKAMNEGVALFGALQNDIPGKRGKTETPVEPAEYMRTRGVQILSLRVPAQIEQGQIEASPERVRIAPIFRHQHQPA